MRISPEAFVKNNRDRSYEELLSVRDELISVIQKFEAEAEHDPEDVLVKPLEDDNYYCNMLLLGGLCNLIAEKFGEKSTQDTEYTE